jgi:hypothetical protein
VQTAALVAVVVAATAGGGYALTRAFRDPDVEPGATRPKSGNGKIAFVSDRDGNKEIYVIDPDGSNLVRLTNHPGVDTDPTWSPDGSEIAFISDRSGNPEVHIMNADGSGTRRLTESRGLHPPPFPSSPDWSPDGSTIAFFAGTREELADCPPNCNVAVIYVVSSSETRSRDWTDLSNVEPAASIDPRYERFPSWSRDGKKIAFQSFETGFLHDDPPPHDPDGVFVFDADGRNRQGPLGAGSPVHIPKWSPTDDRLLLDAGRSIRVGWLRESGLHRTEEIASNESAIGQSTWSPDGTRIAYFAFQADDNRDVYVVYIEGGDHTNITNHPSDDFAPAWQPVPIGTPTVAPTATTAPTSPSPTLTTPAPQRQPGQKGFESSFGPLCGFSGTFGDFDGDGKQDRTAVAFPRTGEGCPAFPETGSWLVYVMWGSGASGAWPLGDCIHVCGVFGAADLDGDEADEFFLVVDAGAATVFLHVYELTVGERQKHPVDVAPPGAEGYPAKEPALFPYGGSVTHQDFITCNVGDGFHSLIATSAVLDQDLGEWNVHETILSLDRGAFTVVSSRDYQVTHDPSGDEPLPVPGDSCFALD